MILLVSSASGDFVWSHQNHLHLIKVFREIALPETESNTYNLSLAHSFIGRNAGRQTETDKTVSQRKSQSKD